MGLFDKARNLYSVQKQSKAIKKDLKNIHVEASIDGITVVISGELEIISIDISPSAWENFKTKEYGDKKLCEAFKKAFSKTLKRAQEIASSKMKGLWQEMGIGG